MKISLVCLLLISSVHLIKIKIRTPVAHSGNPSPQPQTPNNFPSMGGWNTKRRCDAIANGVQVGDLFVICAQQLQSIFDDNINELLLVKHEYQIVAGSNHKLMFRLRDINSGNMIYIGFGLYIDLQGGVRMNAYLESGNKADIIAALKFSNSRLFRYRCGQINQLSSGGFIEWARELLGGGGVPQHQTGGFDDLDDLDNQGQGYNPHQTVNTMPVGGDSPFEEKTININIRGRHPDGTPFLIGSSKPKK